MTKATLPVHPAKLAIDDAFDHYFTNLTANEKKLVEITFLGELITQIEPWLFFTGPSVDMIYELIDKAPVNNNLINTITVLFYMRYTPTEEYLHQINQATAVGECLDLKLSFMPIEHHNRIPNYKTNADLLKNNRSLVMILTMIMYFDTSILASHVG